MKILKNLLLISGLFFPTKLFSQKHGSEILITVNAPYILFINATKNAKYPLGGSLIARFFLSEKLALTSSVRYDNFIYKPIDSRIGYLQAKIGLMYFINLYPGVIGEIARKRHVESYLDLDFGLAGKATGGSFNRLAYSIGGGARWTPKKRIFLNMATNWVGISLAENKSAGWLDTRIGLGYFLGK